MRRKCTQVAKPAGYRMPGTVKKTLLLLAAATTWATYGNAQFTEGFESGMPAGWTVINGGDANTWVAGAPSNGSAYTGSNTVSILYDEDIAHNDYLITPPITVIAGVSDRISFWARNRSSTFLEAVNVKLSTSGTATSDFTISLASGLEAPTSWTKYTYSLNAYAGQTVYFAVQAISLDKWELYLDDFVCDALPPPPANDEASGAIALTVNSDFACGTVTSGYTENATQSADAAPGCSASGINDDVWYSFTATGAVHRISFSNVSTGTMAAALYTGTPGSLTAVSGACASTTLNATGLTPGTTYYVRAYTTSSSASTTATFSICAGSPPPPPANDECAGAITVPVNPASTCTSVISGSLVGATASAGPSSNCGTYDDDVWYAFTATADAHTITLQNLGGSVTDLTFQVLSGCGASSSLICSDPQSNVITGLTPGNTYYLRVASYTSTPFQTSTFDVCITTVPMAFVSATTTQSSTATVTAGSIDQQIIRAAVVVSGNASPLSVTQLNFNTTGSTSAANIAAAKVYYTGSSTTFSTATPFGTAVASPNGNFTVTGNQALTSGTSNTSNYFWLVYDVSCQGVPGNVLDAQCTSVTVGGSAQTPTATNPSGTRTISGLISTNQPSTSTVNVGATNSQILRVDVLPCGASSTVESITFSTTGSTAPVTDIAAAKVYYTSSSSFATTTPFGTATANPNGTFTVTGSQSISSTGYFWLTYDLGCSAVPANVIDGSCINVVQSGSTYTPATANPSGTRTIANPSGTNQPTTTTATAGSANNPVLRVDVSGCTGSLVTSLTLGTANSTNAADITMAKVYYTPSSTFTPSVLFGSFSNPSGAFTITGNQALTTGSGYFWITYDLAPGATAGNVIDASCASVTVGGNVAAPATANPSGTRSIVTPTLANDDAAGAIALTVGAGCTGAPYTNVTASMSAGEPYPACSGSPYGTVWFSFVAPAEGAVRVSTDMGSGASFTDHKIALFSATNVNDYSTFLPIACDDDGGSSYTLSSVLYATGLTAGTTYYVAVDRFGATTTSGTFCIAVDALTSSMLSTSNTCNSTYQTPVGDNNYTGWVPLLDGSSRLVALVRNPSGGAANAYTGAQYVNSGAIRQDATGAPYLNRNFRIANSTAGNYEVQLFFLSSEQAALEAVNPAATLGNLNITRQSGESGCTSNFSSGGTNTIITQSGSGSANGVSWIAFSTPGFSNFFIHGGNSPLPVSLYHFTGVNEGRNNRLDWATASEYNFSHFELERSADGIMFRKIATIDGRKQAGKYAYTDEQALTGLNIYRLNMVDPDGKATQSGIVKLTIKQANDLSVKVYPNPVQQQLTISLQGKADTNAQVQLLDLMGKVLQTVSVTGNSTIIRMGGFAAGTYLLRYTDDSHNSVIKISKD